MKVYNKLVRDKVPEIIKADGKECKTRILSKDEYIAALETKLNEEDAQYQEDKNLEEMADVLEVLQAIGLARGYSLDELEAMRIKKAKERGGFKDKIFLEYVAEKRQIAECIEFITRIKNNIIKFKKIVDRICY